MRGTSALAWVIRIFGISCCAIAPAHLALGIAAIPGAGTHNATLDSENRFYAAMFLGFGGALVWTAMDLQARAATFRALMGVFFVGGLGRVASWIAMGPPAPLFIGLLVVELVFPAALVIWSRRG